MWIQFSSRNFMVPRLNQQFAIIIVIANILGDKEKTKSGDKTQYYTILWNERLKSDRKSERAHSL